VLLGRSNSDELTGVGRMLREALRGRGAPSDNVEAWDVAEVAEERVMESPSS